MNKEEIKAQVTAAVGATWPRFQQDHPALAQVIDQTMLCEHVVESLAKDEEFTQAYELAVSARVGAQVFTETVTRFVDGVLRRLR